MMKSTQTISKVVKVTKKERVICQQEVHQATGHTKEEAMAKAKDIIIKQAMENHRMGYRPCDCKHHHGLHDITDEDFELPSDAWIPRKTSSKLKEEMPTDFSTLPFTYPGTGDIPGKIKEILKFSLKQQKEDEISDNSAVVTHLVSRCLTAAGIENRIAYGYRRAWRETQEGVKNEGIKLGSDGRLSNAPHVWLVIDGQIIDTTYIKDMPIKCCKYITKHTPDCYTETLFENSPTTSSSEDNTSGAEPPTIEETARLTSQLMKARIDFCRRQPDMALALSHNREQFYNYFFAMMRHMYEEYGVTVQGIDPTVRYMCWWCGGFPQKGKGHYSDTLALKCEEDQKKITYVSSLSKRSWRLMHCSRCMVALYCSRNCQRQDWDVSHHATCLSRGSMYLPPITNIPY